MRTVLAALLVVGVVACGDRAADIDFGGEDLGSDHYAILSEEGTVKMGLTDRYVYFAPSDSVIAEARAAMAAEARQEDGQEGGPGFFAGMLDRAVGKVLQVRARLPVEEIRDIRWENGAMRIEFVDPDRRLDKGFAVDDQPVIEAFGEAEVRAFAEAFRRVKTRQGS